MSVGGFARVKRLLRHFYLTWGGLDANPTTVSRNSALMRLGLKLCDRRFKALLDNPHKLLDLIRVLEEYRGKLDLACE